MPGYISLHRDIQEHWVYKEARVYSRYEAWLDILMRVNHAEGKVTHNGTVETVLRGSTIWSMGDMEKHWGWSNKKVKRFLLCLVDDQMLSVNSTTKKTYLTVINYGKYQGSDNEEAPTKHQQSTTDAFQKHNRSIQTIISNKRPLKPSYQKQVFDEQSFEYRLAKYLYNSILKFKPDLREPNLQSWSKHVDYLIRIDKRDPKEIGQVIDWVTTDDFWQTNILSTSKLRSQWDTVTAKMKKGTFKSTNKQPTNLQLVTVTDEQRKEQQDALNKQRERNGLSGAVNI